METTAIIFLNQATWRISDSPWPHEQMCGLIDWRTVICCEAVWSMDWARYLRLSMPWERSQQISPSTLCHSWSELKHPSRVEIFTLLLWRGWTTIPCHRNNDRTGKFVPSTLGQAISGRRYVACEHGAFTAGSWLLGTPIERALPSYGTLGYALFVKFFLGSGQ